MNAPLAHFPYDGPERYEFNTAFSASQKKSKTRVTDLAPMWEEFALDYTHDATSALRTQAITCLNTAAFGRGGLKALLKTRGIDPLADKATIDGQAQAKFDELKAMLEDVCIASSNATSDAEWRPLNRTLIDGIMRQWIALEEKLGLYPPTSCSQKDGISNSQLQKIEHCRSAIMHTPEGSLLALCLWSLNYRVIEPTIQNIYQKEHKKDPRITYENVRDYCMNKIKHSLFSYDPARPNAASFPTYLHNGMHIGASSIMKRMGHRDMVSLDITTGRTGKSWSSQLISHQEPNPAQLKEKEDLHNRLSELMDKFLDERQKDILTKLLGIGTPAVNSRQIAADLGITRSRVQQIKAEALQILREALEEKTFKKQPAAHQRPSQPPQSQQHQHWVRLSSKNAAIHECRKRIRLLFATDNGEIVPLAKIAETTGIHPKTLAMMMGKYSIGSLANRGVLKQDKEDKLAKYLRDTLHKPESDIEDFRERVRELRAATMQSPAARTAEQER